MLATGSITYELSKCRVFKSAHAQYKGSENLPFVVLVSQLSVVNSAISIQNSSNDMPVLREAV
jgi:hypothetical protein